MCRFSLYPVPPGESGWELVPRSHLMLVARDRPAEVRPIRVDA